MSGRLEMNKCRLTSLIRLSYLAPEIVGALLAGRHPIELTPTRLLPRSKYLPHDWKGTAPFPRLRRLNLTQNPDEMLHIRRLENGLERPCGRSGRMPRHLASLVGADAFVEDCPVQRISGNGFGRGQTILIEGKDQTKNHREPLLAALSASRITSQTRRARDSLILSRSLSQKP
jgi:hypothetical protein